MPLNGSVSEVLGALARIEDHESQRGLVTEQRGQHVVGDRCRRAVVFVEEVEDAVARRVEVAVSDEVQDVERAVRETVTQRTRRRRIAPLQLHQAPLDHAVERLGDAGSFVGHVEGGQPGRTGDDAEHAGRVHRSAVAVGCRRPRGIARSGCDAGSPGTAAADRASPTGTLEELGSAAERQRQPHASAVDRGNSFGFGVRGTDHVVEQRRIEIGAQLEGVGVGELHVVRCDLAQARPAEVDDDLLEPSRRHREAERGRDGSPGAVQGVDPVDGRVGLTGPSASLRVNVDPEVVALVRRHPCPLSPPVGQDIPCVIRADSADYVAICDQVAMALLTLVQ